MSSADRLAAAPRRAGLLLAVLPGACLAPLPGPLAESPPVDVAHCQLTPPATTGGRAPGLIVAADVLLPDGHGPDYGVHIRFNGRIGAVADFETVREAYPAAAALDCRGRAVLSPGFVNAHEHPAYSYAFPDASLNPGYAHRDEWRLGAGGMPPLPQPEPLYFDEGDPRSTAALVAMELRHLLGGATAIAGTGGVPGVIRNINRHVREGDPALYDAEADVSTFPFSPQVVEDLRDECAGGPAYRFPAASDDLAHMAYVAHVGEGRFSSCAARAEVARYLERAERRDRRYALVHGVATDRADYAAMREFDVTLVWSPRSNLALYGETVDIAGALEHDVRVALSTDWSPSGSFNMRGGGHLRAAGGRRGRRRVVGRSALAHGHRQRGLRAGRGRPVRLDRAGSAGRSDADRVCRRRPARDGPDGHGRGASGNLGRWPRCSRFRAAGRGAGRR